MNVMEMVSGAQLNGAVMHCLLLARALTARGHSVTVVCRPGAWIAQQLSAEPVEVITSDLHRWPLDELRRIAALARGRRIDVVHTHMSRAHFFGVLLRRVGGLPSVATAHSRHIQLHWMLNDHVIAVSDATRRYHRNYNFVRPSRIEVIHNFIDYKRFADVRPAARAAVRASFDIADAVPFVGFIAQLVPEKGVAHLIRSLQKIVAAVPETRLLIAGEGPDEYKAHVKSAAEQLGVASKILWAGRLADLPGTMAALDAFVLPSLEENLPMSVLEAMAAGLPVVATAVGGVPECISAGETGFLVPPADSDALAEAIIRLLSDAELRRRFGEAARKRVRQHFSPETQVPRTEALLARVAATGRVR